MKAKTLPGRSQFLSLTLLLLSALLSSCVVASKTSSVDVEAEFVGREGFLMAKPIVADIKVEKRKIEGSATVENSKYAGSAMQEAKNLAILDAVNRGDADLLIQPMFETQSTSTTTTAKVTGYAAKYKEFRPITAADTASFLLRSRMEYSSLIAVATAPTEVSVTQQPKKKGGAILGVLSAIALVALLAGGI
jgi:hypothetical protein